ncbi:MAG: N-acetyltransferase [Oscillospiraceae bacterium]|nr:N-acetyltransferase [Oscillospiraceae bacterium]
MERIYAAARAAMIRGGNPHQWGLTHPSAAVLRADIEENRSYICVDGGRTCGVFALIFGADPTYAVIDGAWHADRPYAAIHRLAADGRVPGIFDACLAFAKVRSDCLRADTHADNRIMQHLLTTRGFLRCGIIRIADGSPRIAYDLLL